MDRDVHHGAARFAHGEAPDGMAGRLSTGPSTDLPGRARKGKEVPRKVNDRMWRWGEPSATLPRVERAPSLDPQAAAPQRVRLVDVEPDLPELLQPEELVFVRRHLHVPVAQLPTGPWLPEPACEDALAVIVLDGLLARTTELPGCSDMQLFGPGDVVDPRLFRRTSSDWRVIRPATLALVDERLLLVGRHCPRVTVWFTRRLFDGHREQQALAEIRALPRVEERILELVSHLAWRWGTVTPDGIALVLPITHRDLGLLVRARRPTTSIALKELERAGALGRLEDGRWLVAHASGAAVLDGGREDLAVAG